MHLRVSWIGKPSTNLEKEVKTAEESCYGSVSTRLVFTSKRMLPVARKDVLPTTQKSFIIYEYKCHCDSRYVGRTSRRLHDRIKQHVPQWLRQQLTCRSRFQPHRSCKRNDTKPGCDSAIGQHLLENDQCALNYENKRFLILATKRSSFHLNLLEGAYIKTQEHGVMQTERVCLHFQTLLIIAAFLFGLLMHFSNISLFQNLSLTLFAIVLLLALLDCLTSQLIS